MLTLWVMGRIVIINVIGFDQLGGNNFDGVGEYVVVIVNSNRIAITDVDGTFVYLRTVGISSTGNNEC